MVITGIYKITNPNGQVYIGSSNDIKRRWKEHKSNAKLGKNIGKLSDSFAKFGFTSHVLEIVEICDVCDLFSKEGYWQQKLDSISESNLNQNLINDQMVKVAPLVTEETYNNILIEAKKQGKTLSAMTRKIIEDYFNRDNKQIINTALKCQPKDMTAFFNERNKNKAQ